jgi:hypothetical protein
MVVYEHKKPTECIVGILAKRWRLFHGPLNAEMQLPQNIIRGCSVLHNYVRIRHEFRLEDILPVPEFEDESERNVSGDLQLQHPVAFNIYKISKTEFLLSMTISNFYGNYRPHSKGLVQQFFYCCVCIHCRSNVFTEPLPSNDMKIHIWTHRLMGGIYEVRR